MKKFLRNLALLGLGSLSTLVSQGCSISKTRRSDPSLEHLISSAKYASKKLNRPVRNVRLYTEFSRNYAATKERDLILRTLAGIFSGPIQPYKENGKIMFSRSYSQSLNPKAMIGTLKIADVDRDGIVTNKEIEDLLYSAVKKIKIQK